MGRHTAAGCLAAERCWELEARRELYVGHVNNKEREENEAAGGGERTGRRCCVWRSKLVRELPARPWEEHRQGAWDSKAWYLVPPCVSDD